MPEQNEHIQSQMDQMADAKITGPSALSLIQQERDRQIQKEGYDSKHDDAYISGALAMAAACYATPEHRRQPKNRRGQDHITRKTPVGWPWADGYFRPTPKDRIRELVKAGALIVAEIERLQRK